MRRPRRSDSCCSMIFRCLPSLRQSSPSCRQRQSNSHLYDWVIASPSGMRPWPATASRWRPMATRGASGLPHGVCLCRAERSREHRPQHPQPGAEAGPERCRHRAICTGTYVMAAAGLLEDRRCTIHWENIDGLSEEFPELDIPMTCSRSTAHASPAPAARPRST